MDGTCNVRCVPRFRRPFHLSNHNWGSCMDDDKRANRNHTTPVSSETRSSPWLTVTEAADRARCGVRLIYREVRASRLRAARVGGRRELRIRAEWIDRWLDVHTTPQEIDSMTLRADMTADMTNDPIPGHTADPRSRKPM